MKRLPPLTVVTALAFTLAWFLPVHKEGSTLRQGVLPGWEAFLIALDIDGSDAVTAVISIVSALTNGLMLFALVRQVRRPTQAPPRWLAAGFLAATAIDLWWASDSDRADLRIGYWLWVGSFALMAVAIWLARRRVAPARNPGRLSWADGRAVVQQDRADSTSRSPRTSP